MTKEQEKFFSQICDTAERRGDVQGTESQLMDMQEVVEFFLDRLSPVEIAAVRSRVEDVFAGVPFGTDDEVGVMKNDDEE